MQIKINNKTKNYNIIGHNKYNEKRNRMSVVIGKNNGSGSVLLCKAYDISAFKLISPIEQNDYQIDRSKKQIEELTNYGFRYFILLKRELNGDDTSNFINMYKSAENYIVKSEEHLNKVAMTYEIDMTFLGLIFFKETIDPDLKYSIALLNRAGIKTWIASGDKKENVLSIGRALDLYDPKSIIGDFNDKDKPEDLDIKMSTLLMQFLFPNDKINKMKSRAGGNIGIKTMVSGNSKKLTLIISGNCFSRICKDQRNYQSLATLLTYSSYLLGYNFSPNNKLVLCKMIKDYSSKNSRLLAIGDGFNDFSMLREADLSIGIISKEILQVRNACDVIVSSFSQIVNLILVHGTWNYKKILKISVLSFYFHFLLLIPKLLYLNENFNGFSFYDGHNNLIFTLNVLVINLFILFMITFDVPVEKALIILNTNIFKDNIYNENKLIFIFGIEALKSLIDSGIVYMVNKLAAQRSKNILGKNVDISLFGNQILYASYALVIIKIFFFNINYVNFMHLLFIFICIICLLGITYIDSFYHDSVVYGITHLCIILSNILVIFGCCLHEVISRYVLFLLDYNFLAKLSIMFHKRLSDFLFLKNFKQLLSEISNEIPRVQNKLDKISFIEVLNKIYKANKQLDPALENMADVSNDEACDFRIEKPILRFFDEKVEMDYTEYCNKKVAIPFLAYLISLLLFLSTDLIIIGFEKRKIAKIVYIVLGLFLLIPKLKENFSNVFPFYFSAILIIELIFIYENKSNNDIKICLQNSVLINFSLFYCPKRAIISAIIILYIISITPAIFLNDFGINTINGVYQKNFLYKNLCLVYLRQMSIYGVVILLFISSHYIQLRNRIEFLKYQKSQLELKKDNLIMTNLIPDFVRAKMQRGERGAAYGYEEVTIVFCDISNFNSLMAKLLPKDIILLLDQFYSILDQFCQLHGLQKIETVGKTYMAAGGIRECEVDVDKNLLTVHHSIRAFEFALDILYLIEKMVFNADDKIHVKIGIHKGKVIPAVVGDHKPQFSLIGDAVNTTSRMSSNGEKDCIACSDFAYDEIKSRYKTNFTQISKEIKGKGMMNIYLYKIPKKGNSFKEHFKILQSKSSLKNIDVFMKKATKASKKKYSIIRNIDSSINESLFYTNNENNNLLNNNSLASDSLLIIDNSKDSLMKRNEKEKNNIFADLNLFDNNTDLYNYNNFNGNNNKKDVKKTYTMEKKEHKYDNFKKNVLFSNSFLLYRFKNEVAKNTFRRFETFLLNKSLKKSVSVNVTLIILLLYSEYSVMHFAKIDDDYLPYLSFKFFSTLLLIIFTFLSDRLVDSFPKIKFIFLTLIYISISVINMLYNEKLNTFNLINITVEEIVILTVIESCGIFNYLELSLNIFFHMIIYILDIITNKDKIHIRNYYIFLSIIALIKLINIIILYYDMTSIFLTNQKEAKTLVETEKMLFNLMPLHVVQNMKDDIPVADVLENVTLLFADIVGYTSFGNSHEPVEVVGMLMVLFKNFDNATKECNVYKVHTIGDCYVVMGFNGKVSMNERNYYEEAKNVCKMGEQMIKIIRDVRKKVRYEALDMRIGIHTGRVIAGIIGSSVVRYDIFGSDVLIANQMESSGTPGRINISEETKKLLETKDIPYEVKFNKEVNVDSVDKKIKCYLIENEIGNYSKK